MFFIYGNVSGIQYHLFHLRQVISYWHQWVLRILPHTGAFCTCAADKTISMWMLPQLLEQTRSISFEF